MFKFGETSVEPLVGSDSEKHLVYRIDQNGKEEVIHFQESSLQRFSVS